MEKYGNKSPAAKIFHKYTGFITVGIVSLIIFAAWYVYESDAVFFEHWSCERVMSMSIDSLTPKEYLRFEEIRAECIETLKFTEK